jgi:adenylosuccinate lyase
MIRRYQTAEMSRLFSEEYKLEKWLYVEMIVAQIEERTGIIPRGLSRKLNRVKVTPKRVNEIEKVTNHDVIAFLQAVREKIGKQGKWLHFGLTSYDLVDTAFVMTIREAIDVVTKDIKLLGALLKKMASRYRHTPQMGRTHGVFAQPITFGYKVASWREEVTRSLKRLTIAREEISYGKLSGAVGTYTMLSPGIEKKVMKKLKLRAEPVSTQVIPRDRFAFLVSALAIYACACERISTEIRNLSRTEIDEVREPFTKGQKGSSAMPHKKNPIICERICGLARVVRSAVIPAYENITLWHERDITNSSVERVIIPDTLCLVHYITKKLVGVLRFLTVNKAKMMENLNASLGVYASQHLMNCLIEKGMGRTESYKIVQKLSFQTIKEKRPLEETVKANRTIRTYLSEKEIEKIFDLKWFLRHISGK